MVPRQFRYEWPPPPKENEPATEPESKPSSIPDYDRVILSLTLCDGHRNDLDLQSGELYAQPVAFIVLAVYWEHLSGGLWQHAGSCREAWFMDVAHEIKDEDDYSVCFPEINERIKRVSTEDVCRAMSPKKTDLKPPSDHKVATTMPTYHVMNLLRLLKDELNGRLLVESKLSVSSSAAAK